uniref:1 2-dihydroxy-3-keto-5-methylthiopentene dioxygenase n=1 Tax=Rhizophora mucronata TaxID=61149 RepID=A0A2P2JGU2_RHIMU
MKTKDCPITRIQWSLYLCSNLKRLEFLAGN